MTKWSEHQNYVHHGAYGNLKLLAKNAINGITLAQLGNELLPKKKTMAGHRRSKSSASSTSRSPARGRAYLPQTPSTSGRNIFGAPARRRSSVTHRAAGGINVINAANQYAEMKKSGKVKSIKKGKTVHVSQKLREKIKKVMQGQAYSGHMVTHSVGTVGRWARTVSKTAGGTSGMYAAGADDLAPSSGSILAVPLMNDSYANGWCYWGGSVVNDLSTASAMPYQNMFEHFSPMQFLDAASKMWNNKPSSTRSWYVASVDNIQTDVYRATGIPETSVTAQQTAPLQTALKLQIVNSYATYTIRNTGYRRIRLQIFHCTPKVKYPGMTALNDLVASCQLSIQGAASNGAAVPVAAGKQSLFQTQSTSISTNGYFLDIMQHPEFDPKDCVTWKTRWNYQLIDINLGAGETCQHTLQGPKNTLIDFSKLQNTDSTGFTQLIPTHVKGFSASVFMRLVPDLVTVDGVTNQSSNFSVANAAGVVDKEIVNPIAIDVAQCYHLKCPETAGFITKASYAAGGIQNLNLKRKIKRFENYSLGETTTSYVNSNDNNPFASAAQSQRN